MTPETGDGYFPPGSVLRRVHSQRAVGLLYGQRALMIGAVRPLNFIGTWEHTEGHAQPFRRLVSTANAFERIFFGTRTEADKVLAYVRKMHERVKGELPEPVGPVAAGTPYSALDPELMLWTVAVIADSAEYFHELLVRPLSGEEREGLWRDYLRFGELFGMPPETAPQTHAEFRRWWDDALAGDDIHLSERARDVGHAIAFRIPLPRVRGSLAPLHNLIMLGSLPPRVRELYGLEYGPARRRAFRSAVAGLRASRRVSPRPLRRGLNTSQYNLVAATERRRLARGKPTATYSKT